MSLLKPPGTLSGTPSAANTNVNTNVGQEITPPKCFGTDYYGKWNMTGMTFESMKIDRPDYQMKCANCSLFERCYMANHIRILRIKR